MNLSDRFLRFASLGMGHDPEDIIDYIAECFSVVVSLVVALAVAIFVGKFVTLWMAPIGGLGAYAIGVAIGTHLFLSRPAKR